MLKKVWTDYKKAIVAAGGVVLSAVVTAFLGDGIMDFNEFANVVILGTGAVGVGVAANTPGSKYAKAILAAISAAATVLISVHTGGLTSPEVAQIVVAVLTAAGVWRAPNKDDEFARLLRANAVRV